MDFILWAKESHPDLFKPPTYLPLDRTLKVVQRNGKQGEQLEATLVIQEMMEGNGNAGDTKEMESKGLELIQGMRKRVVGNPWF